MGVAVDAQLPVEAGALNPAGGLDPLPDRCARLCRGAGRREIGRRDGGNRQMDIDPVQQRPRDPRPVALYQARLAAAVAQGIAEMAGGTPLRSLFAV
jgi:hypothetical protein